MNQIIKNKYIIIAIALIIGGLIGWIIKPSDHQTIKSSINQTINGSDHKHDGSSDNQVWTCSMHPQVRQSEPGQCPICGMDLIPVSSDRSATSDPMVHEMTPESVAMAKVQTSKVTGVAPEGETFLTGKVKADEQLLASVTAKFPGRIERLYVNFTGQMIRQGERLATIYSPELLTAQKELLEAANTKESYSDLYDAAREKLRLWKLTEDQIDEIERTEKVRDQFDIMADKGGIVVQRNITVGDYVSTGSVLFNVVDLSRVWIMMDAYETDLPLVKVGDKVSFTVPGVPGKTFTAQVNYIDPVIDPDTRAASVRAEVRNPDGELKPEMFVNAQIHTSLSGEEASLAIPRTALLWSGKRSVVYIKVPNTEFPTYEMREITIGPRIGEMYLVEAGLDLGEEIVTNGVFAIDAAAQLSGNYSMMMRPESKTMEVPPAFKEQITAIAEAYFEVKNALVNDEIASEEALGKFREALGRVEMQHLQGQSHDHWMALQDQLSEAIEMMEKAGSLKSQRQHFAMLSDHVLEMTESFGLEKESVYKQFCPMAFENEGAYWLSEIEEIRNPYFGEAMLTCGEVIETYRKEQPVYENETPGQQQSSAGHQH